MKEDCTFGILGGDKRQVAMAESIASDGYSVFVYGFDDVAFQGNIKKTTLSETVNQSDVILLPLPVSQNGTHLKIVYSKEQVVLNDAFAQLFLGKSVFGGKMEKLYQTSKTWEKINAQDFSLREEFAIQNAVPTAEGAIGVAIREYPGTIHGSSCLVAGFGRIGKVLAWMLRGLGAHVTVSARKGSDFSWIQSFGYDSVPTSELWKGTYHIIFNTIPDQIFNQTILSKISNHPIIIDLASLPGGVDLQSAKEAGIPVTSALALPGKVAPQAAGEIMKDTILTMLKE